MKWNNNNGDEIDETFESDDQGDCDIVHDDDSIMTAIIIIIKINKVNEIMSLITMGKIVLLFI